MSHDETTASELIAFMQENMLMKQDLERFATKNDLMSVKSDVMTTIEERLMAVERKVGV